MKDVDGITSCFNFLKKKSYFVQNGKAFMTSPGSLFPTPKRSHSCYYSSDTDSDETLLIYLYFIYQSIYLCMLLVKGAVVFKMCKRKQNAISWRGDV